MTGFDDDIIESVGALQLFMGCGIGQINHVVIISVADRLAPARAAFYGQNCQFGQGPDMSVMSPIHMFQAPNSHRAAAIALFFEKNPP